MASNNIARLGVVLGLDSAQFQADIDKAVAATRGMAQSIKRDTNAAAGEIINLTHATEDYGKTLTKVEQIQREITSGRFMNAEQKYKDELLARAAAYDRVVASQNKVNKGLTDQQRIAITYQMTDLVTQIASGQNAMIALMQQGGQLKDQLGGIGNMFRILGSFITPTAVALAAAAGTVGTLTAAFILGSKESSEFRDNMILTSNYSGLFGANIDVLTAKLKNDLKVSSSEARSALMELGKSGQFTDESIQEVSKAILNFAMLSGVNAKEAAQQLASSFNGTAASAKNLNDKYHFLTLEQYKYIDSLERAGQKQKAIQVTAEAFNQNIQDQARELGYLERAWNGIGKAISDAWDSLKGFGREDLGQKLAEIERNIASAESKIAEAPNSQQAEVERRRLPMLRQKLDQINAQIAQASARAEAAKKETAAIDLFAATGGTTGYLKRAEELYRQQYANRLQQMMEVADEELKLELKAAHDIEVARAALKLKNQEEGNKLAKENAKQLAAYEEGVIIKLNQDVRAFRRQQFAESITEQQRELEERRQIFADFQMQQVRAQLAMRDQMDVQEKSLEFDRARVVLRSDLVFATTTEQRIAEARLDTEQKIWELQRNKMLSSEAQKEGIQKLKEIQAQRENLIAFEESIARVGAKWDSVFTNMSNALENFVRTGKLSFKDLARSIIADLISIEMKAQGKLLFGLMKAAILGKMGPGEQAMDFGTAIASGTRASGGTVTAGSPYMVGERGPELFVPGTSGTIIPNNNLGSAGGGQVINNYNISAIDVKSFEDRIFGSARAIWAANAYANKGLATAQGRV